MPLKLCDLCDEKEVTQKERNALLIAYSYENSAYFRDFCVIIIYC